MTLAQELETLIRGQVDATDATRATYSHDASIFEVTPQVVVFPLDVADVQKVVSHASRQSGVAIVARGGGTDMGGGSIGAGITLDMTRHLNALGDMGRDNTWPGQEGYAMAQPGIWYRDFEKATLSRGMIMPSFPGSREIATLGGMTANNAGGERSYSYGQTIDFVRAVRMVCADGQEYEFGPLTWPELQQKMAQEDWEGQLYRTVYDICEKHYDLIQQHRPKTHKNSSGYFLWRVWDRTTFNMAKLICGSQGTLGVITHITMGLVRPKPQRAMVVAFLHDLVPVPQVVELLKKYKPESIESFDDKTLTFTLRFLPDYIKSMGASNILSLAWQFLPEVGMVLTGGIPKLIMMAEFSGDDAREVHDRAQSALKGLEELDIKARLLKDGKEAQKYWVIRRESFNVLRRHTKGMRTTPFIDDMIVPPAVIPEFLPKLYAILDPYKLTLTINGHAGNGNFHIIPLMDLRKEETRKLIPEISKKVYDLVLSYGGSITAEHNDGLIRGPYVEQQFGHEIYELFRQTKKAFDPKGIFNPGKKIDVDWDWALAHIRKD